MSDQPASYQLKEALMALNPKAWLVLASHPSNGKHRAVLTDEGEVSGIASHWKARVCTVEIEALFSLDQTAIQLEWDEFREMATKAFGRVVDHDLTGKPITDYDVLLSGAYAPAIKRLTELAAHQLSAGKC